MRKDSSLSLKRNPRFKSQLFKYSVQFVCYFTYNTEELAAGKNCRSWLFKKFYIQMGSFLSNLPSYVSKISKHRPGSFNMKELPAGVRGTYMFCCLFIQTVTHRAHFLNFIFNVAKAILKRGRALCLPAARHLYYLWCSPAVLCFREGLTKGL